MEMLQLRCNIGARMNTTLYLKEEDAPIWDRARELSVDKLSNVIIGYLKQYVAGMESAKPGHQRIVLRRYEAGIPKSKAFYGRWIIPPSGPLVLEYSGLDQALRLRPLPSAFAVAETQRGKYAVLAFQDIEHGSREFED